MVATPVASGYYQNALRQLAFEYAGCFLCCKAEDACRAEHWPRIRRMLMVANGGAAVPGSEVLVAAADDSRYWDKEVRRPAMLYLTRGKKGGSSAGTISIPWMTTGAGQVVTSHCQSCAQGDRS